MFCVREAKFITYTGFVKVCSVLANREITDIGQLTAIEAVTVMNWLREYKGGK